MGDDIGFQNIYYDSDWLHQFPLFSSSEERENDQRPRWVQVIAGRSESSRLSTSPHEGQGHSIELMTTQTNTPQRPFGGYSFHSAPYTNQGNHINESSYSTPSQRGQFHITPQQMPPGGHHTQLLSSHPIPRDSLDTTDSMEALNHGFPGQPQAEGNNQAVQGLSASHMGYIQLPRVAPLLPQRGIIDFSPTQERCRRAWLCPVSGCPASFHRSQERKRHLLTHLPYWIHCPDPGCSWRGNRLSAFRKHRRSDHPSSIQEPDKDRYEIYDPFPLVEEIIEGSLCIKAAQNKAISMVLMKASELGNSELCDNPWGHRQRKGRKHNLVALA